MGDHAQPRLVLLGKQGAGKGTQATRLAGHFGVPHDPAELHGAVADAEVNVGVLMGLVDEVERRLAVRPTKGRTGPLSG